MTVLYHGTSRNNVDGIMRQGLRATWDGNYTLTPDRKTAYEYSYNGWSEDEGGCIIEVHVPQHLHHDYLGHDLSMSEPPEGEEERTDGSAWLRKTIPPHYLRIESRKNNAN